MAMSVAKLCKPICSFSFAFVCFSYPIHTISSQQLLEQSIKSAIEAKSYRQIADSFSSVIGLLCHIDRRKTLKS
ncbi:hypothetical protein HanIR_Chr11g0557891 [Helianthus annuus]|nr:hypothetical protein HanIR_Chr11g0557891 [Helianthus annuus]